MLGYMDIFRINEQKKKTKNARHQHRFRFFEDDFIDLCLYTRTNLDQ